MRAETDCMDRETPPGGRCINCKSWTPLDESEGYCSLRGMLTLANHSCERWLNKRSKRVGKRDGLGKRGGSRRGVRGRTKARVKARVKVQHPQPTFRGA